MQIRYAVVAFGISTREAITWRRLAVPAVTFMISPEVNIKSLENKYDKNTLYSLATELHKKNLLADNWESLPILK